MPAEPGRSGERLREIRHEGHRILFIDFSGLVDQDEVQALVRQAGVVLSGSGAPPLTLTDVTGARFGMDAFAALKDSVSRNSERVRATAIVGLSPVQRVFVVTVARLGGRVTGAFATTPEALAWLASRD